MWQIRCKGLHKIEVRDSQGHTRCAVLELRYCRVRLLPPRAKQKRYPALALTVLQAAERNAPAQVDPIDWKLITDLPVRSRAQAMEKLGWYAMRWKIELFHKILKLGCHAEDPRLRTAQRLTNLIALILHSEPAHLPVAVKKVVAWSEVSQAVFCSVPRLLGLLSGVRVQVNGIDMQPLVGLP